MHSLQLLFHFALLLPLFTSQLTVTMMNSSITITETTPNLLLSTSSAADVCGRLVARNNFIYHLSSEGMLDRWNISDFSSKLGKIDLSADLGVTTNNVIDFDVNLSQSQLAVFNSTNLSAEVLTWNIDSQGTLTSTQSYPKVNITPLPTQVFVFEAAILRYYQNPIGSDYMVRVDLSNSETIFTFTHSNASLVLTPDRRMAAAWTKQTKVYFYSTTNFTLLNIYNSSIMGIFYSTGSINFNHDSSLAVIEADKYSSVKIVNLTDFNVLKSYSIGSTVLSAVFLSSDYIALLLGIEVIFWSISNDKQLAISVYSIDAHSYYMDYKHNSFFACYQNKIKVFSVTDILPNTVSTNITNTTSKTTNSSSTTTTNSTTNSLNTTNVTNNPSNTTSQNNASYPQIYNQSTSKKSKTTGSCSYPLQMSEDQQIIYQGLATTLSSATTALFQKVIIIATSTPLTFYFLGFLNYLNFCSLYVLLELQIPEPVFTRLSEVYLSININLLSIFGIKPQIPPLSPEKVTSFRALLFGLTSDFSSSNYLPLAMFIFNCISSEIINYFVSRLERHKWNVLRRAIYQDRFTVVSGQIMVAMIGIVVPWRFVLQASVNNLLDKVNTVVYGTFFLIVIGFPWYYLFQLLRRRRKKLTRAAAKSRKTLKWSSLLVENVMQEWYTCLSNVFYPFLVIFQNDIPFLAAITPYCCFGIYIAYRAKTWRVNGIILSIYPLIFHLTFVIFSVSQDDSLLANSGITCLTVLMLGAVHNLLTLIASTIHGLCSYTKKRKSQNQIQPKEAKEIKVEGLNSFIAQELIVQSKLAFRFRIMRQMASAKAENSIITKDIKMARNRRTGIKAPKKPNNNLIISFQSSAHQNKPKRVCVQ